MSQAHIQLAFTLENRHMMRHSCGDDPVQGRRMSVVVRVVEGRAAARPYKIIQRRMGVFFGLEPRSCGAQYNSPRQRRGYRNA